MKPNSEGHPIYNVKARDLKASASIEVEERADGTTLLTAADTSKIRFELWVQGQKANRLLTWDEFQEWLALFNLEPDGFEAAALEAGIPFNTPDGMVRWGFESRHSAYSMPGQS